MRTYETIAIFRSNATDEYLGTVSKKVEKAITSKPGILNKKDDWGVKRLAYPIQKEKQGRYILWSYQHTEKAPAAIDKCLRFDENILRYVTIVADWDAKTAKEKKAVEKAKKASKPTSERNDRDVEIDYKDPITLSRFINEKGKIMPQRVSGVDATMQRAIATAVKRARQLALLSYTEGFSGGGQQQQQHYSGGEYEGNFRGERERGDMV